MFCVFCINQVWSIDGFHVTSSPPCWWTKTKDLSSASLVRPPEVVRFSIVIGVNTTLLSKDNYELTRQNDQQTVFPVKNFIGINDNLLSGEKCLDTNSLSLHKLRLC